MSTSETDSDSEPVPATDAVSSLKAFAHLSAVHQPGPTGQSSVRWAVDTLATLDFRLVRKDTALHGLIQNCASTILAFFNALLQQGPTADSSCGFIPDIASILRPSFLHLLFQYRRLFRAIATKNFEVGTAPLAVICWVDVVLAKLGDVTVLVAAGLDGDHPDQSLPESLRTRREEDNLRAAMQLPDNWNTLPSMLLSERVSAAAKRLSTRLMLGRYILCPALSGHVGVDDTVHQLLSTFAEFVRQNAARVDELRSASAPDVRYLLQQERLTGAIAISLFAAADVANSIVDRRGTTAFRPQTMTAAMQLLRFVLSGGRHTAQTNVLDPPDPLDIPTNVTIRWGILPQWAWSVWPEYSRLHADTIMCLTVAYVQQRNAGPEALLEFSDLMSTNGGLSDHAPLITIMINLIFRFISALSTDAHSKPLSTGRMSILHGICRLISQWMNHNSCGIQRSKECCKALIVLFGYLSQNEQYFALNELVIECLTPMRKECTCEAWKAAVEDKEFYFLEALGQSFTQTKVALSRDNLPKSRETCAAQLMQFFAVMMLKGVRPPDLDAFTDFVEAVGERVLEMSLNDRGLLCENLLICLATINLCEIDLPLNRVSIGIDEEALWHLAMCRDATLFLAAAFSMYIISARVSVEPLTYLEGLDHLLDIALLICSRHYPPEDEPLASIILPTICDAVTYLLEHKDDIAGVHYTWANARMTALGDVLRSIENGEDEDAMRDGYDGLLRRRLWSTARGMLCEMDGKRRENGTDDSATGREEKKRELVFCRPRLLYLRVA